MQRPVRQEDDKTRSRRPLPCPKLIVRCCWKLKRRAYAPNQARALTQLYGLPRRKEELRREVAEAELGLAYLSADDLLSRAKLWSREKRG